ncbi:head completion/stabilization protein [Clostridium sp. Cult1]|uniref:head completion/stabilization protein n=1 Tax=Clostridium sp. Cult1 TaxID=2079002 RepID=UPI001F2AE87C|nr:head completion/stabilization protein [Clostridium sp. Cult1]MCF6464215.1 hypothetical protein [Clostridium sp. Cult1]
MIEYTDNFNLIKPGQDEFYNVEIFNNNADIIDAELKNLKNTIENLNADGITLPDGKTISEKFTEITTEIGNTEELDTETKLSLVSAINEINQALVAHKAEMATQDKAGHIKLSDIPLPAIATQSESETGTNNTKMMTPLRVANAIDSRVRVIDNRVEINVNGQWLTFIYLPDDKSGSPGNTKLIAGDWNAGYFGEVPGSELITGYDLANTIGLSKGYGQFGETESWLKFAYQGKIQFIAKKPFRYNLSWGDIDNVNAVYGDKTIRINGLTYKVRLMRGANNDPAASKTGVAMHYSEWNRLMLPIHEQAINKNWPDSINVESDIPVWSHNYGTGQNGMYTNDDLHVNGGNGSRCWCQESFVDASGRLLRGGTRITQSSSDVMSSLYTGWRPVLELVE